MEIDETFRRYLRLLGFDAPPTGLAGLQKLVLRQLCCVPFENVSKLHLYGRERHGRITTFSEYLDGIEYRDLGGTCYTANPYFAQLLSALGFDVDLLSADMTTPHVHSCIRVRLDGLEYHVDVGYAAPFRSPMRLDRLPAQVKEGGVTYRVGRSQDTEEITVGVYFGADRVHGYRAHDNPRSLDFFTRTILDSYLPGKTFMSCLRIVRLFESASAEIKDNELLINSGGNQVRTELRDISELEAAVTGPLAMPRCNIREAVALLEELTGKSLFARS